MYNKTLTLFSQLRPSMSWRLKGFSLQDILVSFWRTSCRQHFPGQQTSPISEALSGTVSAWFKEHCGERWTSERNCFYQHCVHETYIRSASWCRKNIKHFRHTSKTHCKKIWHKRGSFYHDDHRRQHYYHHQQNSEIWCTVRDKNRLHPLHQLFFLTLH